MATASTINSLGNYFSGGDLDEVTKGVFSNQPITYDFTGGDALVTFMGATLIGNNGNNGGNVTPGAGGGYSISQTGYVYWTANRGGSTGTSGSSGGTGGSGGSGGGGSITDVSGLKAAVTDSGQTFAGTLGFGVGARSSDGGTPQSQDIPGFAGGGAAGLSAGASQDPITTTGANAGVVVKYIVWGDTYYVFFGSDSQTAGTWTTPIGTSYVKIWSIGKGGNGGPDGGPFDGGGGGGGGGVAYAEFIYNLNVVSKLYSNGQLQISGEYDEVTYSADYLTPYLLVGGGGAGGGGSAPYCGGGGGAGGFVESYLQMFPGTTYTAVIGQGGARVTTVGANGSNGGDTTLTGATTAVGGGFGGTGGGNGSATPKGADGGSGGGGISDGRAGSGQAGQGISGQGSNGGVSPQSQIGSGGGGAGGSGGNGYYNGLMYAGNGGIGKQSSITGTPTYYAGGGGGGFDYFYTVGGDGQGGLGGGGGGGYNGNGGNASPNTGGGGGGGGGTQSGNAYGGNGGSGICILRILTSRYTGRVTGSPTVTTDGNYTIVKFTADGSYTA